ncbi:hypothetical protein LQ954_14115 [Sphingomonas sp. IC-11]|uniref:hypothetical protein n=1 Tax=Sphingomonas sp. IC-11 TaxID=2898528 RepID=UPI001E4B2309|nr:hypothetical protein [Sphingomonas sp. IC-11]MCD2317279.1 hypothetical protein [Sphingomonas sp. IC-11]
MTNAWRGGATHILRSRVLASALDPLVTSGTMFLVQGAVLLTVSKTAFASYSLAYSYVVMGQAVLSALFGGPLITLLSGLPDEPARVRAAAAALRLQLVFAVMMGSAGVGLATAIGLPAAPAVLAALSMIGLSFRDAMRSVLASQLRFSAALAIALWFATITALALGAVWLLTGHVTAEGGLLALAIGALGTVSKAIVRTLAEHARFPPAAGRQLMRMAIWSLPGATFSWLQNSFYLTLVAVNLSLDAAGEISAARMIAVPVLITASGLLRLSQVQATRKLSSEGLSSALRSARRFALACLAAGAIAAGACWKADAAISRDWLPHAYPHLLQLAGAWLAFAAATTARGFFTSLFQAMGRYRELFVCGAIILPFVLGGVLLGPLAFGLSGAVVPMAAGELLLLLLLAARARRGDATGTSTSRSD